eukprot:271653-Chlamydomonas_euryale.AAC.1
MTCLDEPGHSRLTRPGVPRRRSVMPARMRQVILILTRAETALVASNPYHCHTSAGMAVV